MIRVELDLSPLAEAMRALDQNLDESLALAMQQAGDFVSDRARSFHNYVDHTFDLTGSIHAEPVGGTFTQGTLHVDVVADAPYAKFVEDGTRAHPIRATRAKALRFRGRDGRYVFRRSVRHPGTKPRYFLKGALEQCFPQVLDQSVHGLVRAFEKSGFEVA